MYKHWFLFREEVVTCENSTTDFELEIVIEIDASYVSENRILLASSDGQTIYFDSIRDHAVAVLVFDTEDLLVDLCLPRDETYVLIIQDEGRDGFVDGVVEIYIDRVLARRIEGDFGSLESFEITADGVTVETPVPTQTRTPTVAPTRPVNLTIPPNSDFDTRAPSPPTDEPTSTPSVGPTSTPTHKPTSQPSTVVVRATLPPFLSGLLQPTASPTLEPTQNPTVDSTPSPSDLVDPSGAATLSVSVAVGVIVVLCALF